jgi:GNAT superfamily N-acetyltransferase
MSIKFRICTESDLEIVREYVISLYREHQLVRDLNTEKLDRTFWEFTNKPDKGRIVVFDRDNLVVGYAIIVFYWSNEYGGDFIEVDELFVRAEDRCKGIATTFFDWLEKTWHRQAVALSLQTTPTNDRAFTFYQRLGFENSPNRHSIKLLPH